MTATGSDWAEGYVVDVEYVRNFHPGLVPGNLAFAAMRGGVAPPDIDAPFAYLDLGCGNGFTAALVAAGFPHAQVWGNDFLPAHIRNAQAIADGAGLSNAHFVEASFAAMAEDARLPPFDMIVAHGIWSWVSDANRQRIVALLDRCLKPGGLLMVSYNCHPGWDALMPLRRLIAGASGEGSRPERIERALATARALRDAGADYFRLTPAAGETLDVLLGADRSYIAHEFLNESWSLFHPGEVAAELAPAGLRYVGPARIVDGIDALWLTPEQEALVAAAPDQAARESVRDLILDRRFRHDLFVRESASTNTADAQAWFAARRYALARTRADCPTSIAGRTGEQPLPATPHAALLDALAEGPATGADLARRLGLDPAEVTEALGVLVASGGVQPALAPAGEAQRQQSTARFNAAALASARMGDPMSALASPVTGSGVPVPGGEQLLLDAVQFGIPLEAVAMASADGTDVAARFREHRLPVLEMLGVV